MAKTYIAPNSLIEYTALFIDGDIECAQDSSTDFILFLSGFQPSQCNCR